MRNPLERWLIGTPDEVDIAELHVRRASRADGVPATAPVQR